MGLIIADIGVAKRNNSITIISKIAITEISLLEALILSVFAGSSARRFMVSSRYI
jgi:hypothetical protein